MKVDFKKPATILIIVGLIVVASVCIYGVYAALTYTSTHQTAVIVDPKPALTFSETFNGEALAHNSNSIDWGTMIQGETKTATYTVTNTGNVAATIAFSSDVPVGWSLTWTPSKTTLQPTETATGTLTLIISGDTTAPLAYAPTFQVTASQT